MVIKYNNKKGEEACLNGMIFPVITLVHARKSYEAIKLFIFPTFFIIWILN